MPKRFGQGAMKNLTLRFAVVVTATFLGALVALINGGILTPRSFGIAGLAAMIVCGSMWYCALKYFSPVDARVSERQSTTLEGKEFHLRLASFLIVLTFGAWASRGGPWLPRLVGVIVLLLFCIGARASRR